MPNKDKPMRTFAKDPGRPQTRAGIHDPTRASSGQGGKPRMIDVSETGEYRKVTIEMSPKLKKRMDLAVALSDTTQVEFMISALEPKIDECLDQHWIDQ